VFTSNTRTIFSSSAPKIALDEEFPGLPPAVPSVPAEKSISKVTTLDNGVRVVSRDNHGPSATIGLYLGQGPRAERDEVRGASHIVSQLAFVQRSTSKTGLRINRELEDAGAKGWSGVGREHIAFKASSLRPYVGVCADAVAEVALHSEFRPWDVAEGRERVKADQCSEKQFEDAIHSAAFYDTCTLGKSTVAPQDNIESLSRDGLVSFMGSLTDPSNIVIAGVNVSHDELVNNAKSLCGHLESETGTSNEKAEYVGGETRIRGGGKNVKVSVAFPTPGGVDATPFQVLAEILGSGSTYTKGRGLGQGNTRLGKAVSESGFVTSANGFASTHSDAGLVGITAEAFADQGDQLVDFIAANLKALASGVSETECNAAKNRLRLKHANMSSSEQLDSMATQVLSTGSLVDLSAAISNVTASSVAAAAKMALQSNPSIASSGNISSVPRYNVVTKKF